MKILLINPPVFNDIGRVLADSPSLSLLYLAGYLEKHGYSDLRVLDADALRMSWQDLADYLKKEKPDLVGITGASFVMPALIKTVRVVRQSLPSSAIVTGGFGPGTEPEKVLRAVDQAVNFVVIGEGEITMLELVKRIEANGKEFSDINGLAYLDQGKTFKKTGIRDFIKDIDSVPWPAYHLMLPEYSAYQGMHAQYEEMPMPNAVMVASRGCPHRCAFCSLGTKLYRSRDPINVVDEMEFYKNKFKVKSIQIYDDEFIGMSPKQDVWIRQICAEIMKRGLHKKLAFLVQGRCSKYVSFETLRIMRQANFVWIWWGVESGSQKILDFITKDIKVEDVVRDFRMAKKAGIKSLMYLMVGFPTETKADIKLTADIVKKVKPDDVRFHILSPYPGSKLRQYFEDNNLLETTDYYKFDSRHNVIHHTKEMSAEEIKKHYRMLLFRFENGYWYFVKFMAKSLLTVEGWKKIGKRLRMTVAFIKDWLGINFSRKKS